MSDERDRPDPQVNATLLVAHRLGEINEQLRLHNNNNAILARLAEMEKRLIEAMTKPATISPAVESAAMSVQAGLDKLDASIPDKK